MVTTQTIDSYTDGVHNTLWGIQNDTFMYRGDTDQNYSTFSYLETGNEAGDPNPDANFVFEIQMPEAPIDSAKVKTVTTTFKQCAYVSYAATVYPLTTILYGLNTTYEFDTVTWEYRMGATEWATHGGEYTPDSGNVIATETQPKPPYPQATSALVSFNLRNELPGWGELKRYIVAPGDEQWADMILLYWSNRATLYGYKRTPKLTITYDVDNPEGFQNEGDKLTLEPNPANKTQPILKWGASDSSSFTNYIVKRKVSGGSYATESTITDAGNNTYLDTDSLTTDTVYYYQVTLTLTDTYSKTTTKISNEVQFWRPKVATYATSDTLPDAWEEVTGTITGSVTNKPSSRTTTKFIYDWEGDEAALQTHNLTASATSDTRTHKYTSAGNRTPRAKIEDNLGFQSDYTSGAQVSVNSIAPIAIIKGPTYLAKGTAYWFRSDESYSQNSNGTIVSSAWDWSMPGAFTSNLHSDYLAASCLTTTFTAAGTYIVGLKVRDNLGTQSAATSWAIEVYDDTPTILSLPNTKISTRSTDNGESLFSENLFLGKSGEEQRGELIWTGQDFPSHTLMGWSEGEDGRTDVDNLMGYSDSGTKLKIWVTQDKLWLIGYLSNFTYDEKGGEIHQIYWNADFICEEKSNGS
jgi:hypothetical protein